MFVDVCGRGRGHVCDGRIKMRRGERRRGTVLMELEKRMKESSEGKAGDGDTKGRRVQRFWSYNCRILRGEDRI